MRITSIILVLAVMAAFTPLAHADTESPSQPSNSWTVGVNGGVYAGFIPANVRQGPISYGFASVDLNRSIASWNIGWSNMAEANLVGSDWDAMSTVYAGYSVNSWLSVGGFGGLVYIPQDQIDIAAGISCSASTPQGPTLSLLAWGSKNNPEPIIAAQVGFPIANIAQW